MTVMLVVLSIQFFPLAFCQLPLVYSEVVVAGTLCLRKIYIYYSL